MSPNSFLCMNFPVEMNTFFSKLYFHFKIRKHFCANKQNTHPNHFSLLSSKSSNVQNVDQIMRVELVFTKNNWSPLLKYSLDTHSLHSPSHRDMDKQTDNARHLFAWSCYSMNWKTLNLTHWFVDKATISSLWIFSFYTFFEIQLELCMKHRLDCSVFPRKKIRLSGEAWIVLWKNK